MVATQDINIRCRCWEILIIWSYNYYAHYYFYANFLELQAILFTIIHATYTRKQKQKF